MTHTCSVRCCHVFQLGVWRVGRPTSARWWRRLSSGRPTWRPRPRGTASPWRPVRRTSSCAPGSGGASCTSAWGLDCSMHVRLPPSPQPNHPLPTHPHTHTPINTPISAPAQAPQSPRLWCVWASAAAPRWPSPSRSRSVSAPQSWPNTEVRRQDASGARLVASKLFNCVLHTDAVKS